jgi:hypothetical protein
VVVVAKAHDKGSGGHHQEADRTGDLGVVYPNMGAHGADKVGDQADRGYRAERRNGEPSQQAGRSAGQQDSERNHPLLRHPDPVRGDPDKTSPNEAQNSGAAVRQCHHDRDYNVRDVHTPKTRATMGT